MFKSVEHNGTRYETRWEKFIRAIKGFFVYTDKPAYFSNGNPVYRRSCGSDRWCTNWRSLPLLNEFGMRCKICRRIWFTGKGIRACTASHSDIKPYRGPIHYPSTVRGISIDAVVSASGSCSSDSSASGSQSSHDPSYTTDTGLFGTGKVCGSDGRDGIIHRDVFGQKTVDMPNGETYKEDPVNSNIVWGNNQDYHKTTEMGNTVYHGTDGSSYVETEGWFGETHIDKR